MGQMYATEIYWENSKKSTIEYLLNDNWEIFDKALKMINERCTCEIKECNRREIRAIGN